MKAAVVLVACLGVVLARPQAPSSQYGPPDSGYSKGGPGAPGLDGNGDDAGVVDNKSADNETVGETGNDSTTEQIIELTTVSEAPANYNFAYEVKDAESKNDFGHMESRMGDVAMGSYHVLLPDGRMQKVDYVADKDGYRPTVTYTGEAMFGPGVGGGSAGAGGGGGAPAASYGPPASGGGGGGGGGSTGAGGSGGAPAASYGPPASGGGGGGGYRYRR